MFLLDSGALKAQLLLTCPVLRRSKIPFTLHHVLPLNSAALKDAASSPCPLAQRSCFKYCTIFAIHGLEGVSKLKITQYVSFAGGGLKLCAPYAMFAGGGCLRYSYHLPHVRWKKMSSPWH